MIVNKDLFSAYHASDFVLELYLNFFLSAVLWQRLCYGYFHVTKEEM